MRRRLAVGLMLLGSLQVAYAATVLLWRDSVADLHSRWQRQRLDDALRVGWGPVPRSRQAGGAVEGVVGEA
jgi:hypothetical protein